MPQKISRIAIALTISIAAALLLRAAWDSLSWRYVHDSPLMAYAGYLVSKGYVPYRDFFEMNVPGTYFVMWLMGSIFGWGDSGFRVFDLLCMGSISATTFFWMRRFGYLSALAAAVAFPLWYLGYGSGMSLQREYIALVPFAGLLLVATLRTDFSPLIRQIASGILTGVAILIKPQFFVMALPIIVLLFRETTASDSRQRLRLGLFGGIFLPLVVTLMYLIFTGGLKPFLSIAFNYWPLYSHMTRWHEPIGGWDRLVYIVQSSIYQLTAFYLPAAVAGLLVLSRDDSQKSHSIMVGGILAASAIYPALSGQFFGYHWIPFTYVAICAASLALYVPAGKDWRLRSVIPIILVIFMFVSLSAVTIDRISTSWKGYGGDEVPKINVPYVVHEYLSAEMKPGDLVQPLDWTGGAVHGMLMSDARPATRFIYDFHFYHHTSAEYIVKLRREFMDELSTSMPRFIVQVIGDRPWPRGENTTRDFPELQSFLQQHYVAARVGRTFRILERIESTSSR